VGLLLTSQRKQLAKPWIWLGGLLALLIFLPNLLWEIHRHFPTVELLRNVQQSGRNTEMSPGGFLRVQVFILHPLTAPVWIAGLGELLRDREGKGWSALGIAYVVLMVCMLTMHGRMYYPAPTYPMLFAAGGLVFERWFARSRNGYWLRPAYIAVLVVTGVMLAPFAYFPMLTVEQNTWLIQSSCILHLSGWRTMRWSPAADLCRSIWLERNGPGSCGCLQGAAPGGSKKTAGYLGRTTGKAVLSIFSEQKWDCRRRSPVIKATSIGELMAIPEVA
jgi:hypothetical protein